MLSRLVGSARLLKNTRALVLAALFTALQVALSMFSVYIGQTLRISFGYLALAASAATLGPVCAALTGASADILAFLLRPSGPFHPGFTVSVALTGFLYGLFFFRREIRLWRVLAAQAVVAVFVHLGLNTVWLKGLFSEAFWAMLPSRAMKNLLQLPVDVALLTPLLKLLYSRGILPPFDRTA